MGEYCLELRAEDQIAAASRVVERLDPKPIPGQGEHAAPDFPHGEGEHAIEVAEEFVAPLLVCVEHAFGVRVSRHDVPERYQLGTKLRVVVDLSVEDDP